MGDNLTEQFLGDPATWDAVALLLWSVQPLWGGQIISIAGSGATIVRRIGPGARQEQRYETALDREEVAAMLRLLIAHDLLAVELSTGGLLVPDETEIIITVRKGRRAFTLSTWATDSADVRVSTIIEVLRGPDRCAESLTPLYDGPYDGGRSGFGRI